MTSKLAAELLGSFWLVPGGCGSAVLVGFVWRAFFDADAQTRGRAGCNSRGLSRFHRTSRDSPQTFASRSAVQSASRSRKSRLIGLLLSGGQCRPDAR